MTANLYDAARLYDLVWGQYAEGDSLGFYEEQLEQWGEPALELACGSGRLLIPLAEAGFDIVGLDLSSAMLALAQEKAAERGLSLDILRADMRAFHLSRQFRCILAPANSFQHLLYRRDVERCLACTRRHLHPRGRLILQVFNPGLALLARDPKRRYPVGEFPDPAGAGMITVSEQVRYDTVAQISQIRFYCRWPDEQPQLELSFQMRQFFPREIEALLAYNGFEIETAYGSFDRAPLTSEASSQILVCRLAGAHP